MEQLRHKGPTEWADGPEGAVSGSITEPWAGEEESPAPDIQVRKKHT